MYEGHHFFDCMPPFLCHFCCFLRLLPFPSDVFAEWPQKRYIILLYTWYSVWCWKYEILLQFNCGWLASLKTWFHLRLFLASVALAMTLKSHILNFFVFIKFIIKQKLANSFLVTAVAQFTAKTRNSEKAIYVESTSLSCRNFVFSDFT